MSSDKSTGAKEDKAGWSVSLLFITAIMLSSSVFLVATGAYGSALFMILWAAGVAWGARPSRHERWTGAPAHAALLKTSMRRADRPEAALRRAVHRLRERGRLSTSEIQEVLDFFVAQEDEVGREARRLWEELELEKTAKA
jgi:hypothetical protein